MSVITHVGQKSADALPVEYDIQLNGLKASYVKPLCYSSNSKLHTPILLLS